MNATSNELKNTIEQIEQMKPFVYFSFALNLLTIVLLFIFLIYKYCFRQKEQDLQ
jgi:hypothetical protein